jgi:hypothetical protein|nr:MAG TPA: hypothetical protein [Caudoviricetes sp.]
MTPNHDLFRKIFAISNARVNTYDYLPDAEASYPFVYVGENNGSDTPNNDLIGTARQTVHIYGIRAQRAKIDNISAYLESVLKHLKEGYEYNFNHRTTEKQVIADNTDVQPLLHIVLDFTFNYTKKEK